MTRVCTYNDLLIRGNELQSLLYHPAAIHLQSQREHVATNPLSKSQLLIQTAKLHKMIHITKVQLVPFWSDLVLPIMI